MRVVLWLRTSKNLDVLDIFAGEASVLNGFSESLCCPAFEKYTHGQDTTAKCQLEVLVEAVGSSLRSVG